MKNVLVTAVKEPDIDGVSCALAYADFLAQKDDNIKYEAAFESGMHVEADFVCRQLNISPKIITDASNYDEFILLDASEPKGLPNGYRVDDTIEVIDHRMFADYKAFPNAKFRIEPVGAAATQIAEFFYFDDSARLSKTNAVLLLCGIYSNTVNFQADVTTFRDFRMKNWLEKNIPSEFASLALRMLSYKSEYLLENLEVVLRSDVKDDCSQFKLDDPVVVFQLETTLAAKTLSNLDLLRQKMAKLYPNAKNQLLIVQDITNSKTWLLSSNDNVRAKLKSTNLEVISTETASLDFIAKITMRKSVLKAVGEV